MGILGDCPCHGWDDLANLPKLRPDAVGDWRCRLRCTGARSMAFLAGLAGRRCSPGYTPRPPIQIRLGSG
jgi:hypothetical protein